MAAVEILPRDWASRIRRVFRDVAESAVRQAPRMRLVMSRGVESHFTRLGFGGTDPTALGSPVTWSTVRGGLTRATRGDSLFPLLDHTGSMKNAFVGGRYAPRATSTGSMALMGATGFQRLKGERQQFGLRYNVSGWDKPVHPPPRPFQYWDKSMAQGVIAAIKAGFESSKRRRL